MMKETFKVYCKSPKEAKELQEAAFKVGYRYIGSCTEAVNAAAFFIDSSGMQITHQSYDYRYWAKHHLKSKSVKSAMEYFGELTAARSGEINTGKIERIAKVIDNKNMPDDEKLRYIREVIND